MINKGILKIGRPHIESVDSSWVKLVADVDIAGVSRQVWIAVEQRYAKYLCFERSDAFLIGLFPVAYRQHLDIECEAPIGEHLLFQMRSFLIPLLSKYGRSVYPVNIKADVDTTLIQNEGGVGTAISCGVDSLHAIMNCKNPEYPSIRLTHLVLNNVGAFGLNSAEKKGQFAWAIDHATRFCEEYGYELIVLNSNLFEGLNLDFEVNATYLNLFPILAMQKLWNVFIYASSGCDFENSFTLRNNDDRDSCHYDMLLLDCVSNPSLKIYNEGVPYSRFEKMRNLINFKPAHKYLQVCIDGSGGNCGKCLKCRRTLLILDALGALDLFENVFDIGYYKAHRSDYLRHLCMIRLLPGDYMIAEAYEILAKDISFWTRILGIWDYYRDLVVRKLKDILRPTFKKYGLLKRK